MIAVSCRIEVDQRKRNGIGDSFCSDVIEIVRNNVDVSRDKVRVHDWRSLRLRDYSVGKRSIVVGQKSSAARNS